MTDSRMLDTDLTSTCKKDERKSPCPEETNFKKVESEILED